MSIAESFMKLYLILKSRLLRAANLINTSQHVGIFGLIGHSSYSTSAFNFAVKNVGYVVDEYLGTGLAGVLLCNLILYSTEGKDANELSRTITCATTGNGSVKPSLTSWTSLPLESRNFCQCSSRSVSCRICIESSSFT